MNRYFMSSAIMTGIIFVLSLSFQILFYDKVNWTELMIKSIVIFVFSFLISWAAIPYDWNKKKKETEE